MDSDTEELHGDELGTWLGQLQSLTSSLETNTYDRSPALKLTPSLAIESFRSSFLLNDSGGGDEEIDLDAILGELCEIENQLKTQQAADLSSVDTIMSASAENYDDVMDPSAIDSKSKTQAWINSTPPPDQLVRPEQWKRQSQVSHASSSSSASHKSQPLSDADRDSAYLENESLPSSESYLSVGSSNQSSQGSPQVVQQQQQQGNGVMPHGRLEHLQANKLKEEKIKIALEKIKDNNLERLFIRAFSDDGSSKAILVDQCMDVRRVWQILIEKNHQMPDLSLAVVEDLPSLCMERVLEDHDSLVACKLAWPRDAANRILFTKRPLKYDMFRCPEVCLLGESYADKGTPLDREARSHLLEEFFSTNQVPEVEGMLYTKSEGKKVWKRVYCVLRASGIYCNPKGKSKSSRDLQMLAPFENEDLYLGVGWKKKYKSPSDLTFALKHPMVMKKSSKFIKYFCAEDELSYRRWLHGIRIAKHGNLLFDNYRECCLDVQMWESRVAPTLTTDTKVKVAPSLQRRESLPSASRNKKEEAVNRRASTNVETERLGNYETKFLPSEVPILDHVTHGDFGHDSGHESCESIPRRPHDEGTLKKSSRVPILPVTTDVAKSLTLKRTEFVPAQRPSILNGDMTIQRCRKMSDGDVAVKNWRQSRSESHDGGHHATSNGAVHADGTGSTGHSRKSSISDLGHFRRKSLETDSILRDSPPRELGRSDTLRSELRERIERELRSSDTIKRSPKYVRESHIDSVYDEPYSQADDYENVAAANTLPPPMAPISLPNHLEGSERSRQSLSSESIDGHSNRNSQVFNKAGDVPRPAVAAKPMRMSVPPPPPPGRRAGIEEPPPPLPGRRSVMEEAPPLPGRRAGMEEPPPPLPGRRSVMEEAPPPPTMKELSMEEPVYCEPSVEEVDFDDLPPPPPELLMDLPDMDVDLPSVPEPMGELKTSFRKEASPLREATPGRDSRKKPPPPPPKRSSTTQLSNRV